MSSTTKIQPIKRSVCWKVYFFFITGTSLLGMVDLFSLVGVGMAEYANLMFFIVGSIGLFGYSFSKCILFPKFWSFVFVGYLGFTLAYYFITDVKLSETMSPKILILSIIVGLVISIPEFLALFLYSLPSNKLWKQRV